MIKKTILLTFILISSITNAEFINCMDGYKIKAAYVAGDREDKHFFANKLVIILNKECAGKKYITSWSENPAYYVFFSTALAAKTKGFDIEVGVNTNNGKETVLSNDIGYIGIVE
ncbi:hypothetical protein A3759_11815 [Thalassolituus sp. HI0120]|nr:hypothetical protein A3759_11815 [Thalassolituus sp. HI0120]